jgi:hypothetical protein
MSTTTWSQCIRTGPKESWHQKEADRSGIVWSSTHWELTDRRVVQSGHKNNWSSIIWVRRRCGIKVTLSMLKCTWFISHWFQRIGHIPGADDTRDWSEFSYKTPHTTLIFFMYSMIGNYAENWPVLLGSSHGCYNSRWRCSSYDESKQAVLKRLNRVPKCSSNSLPGTGPKEFKAVTWVNMYIWMFVVSWLSELFAALFTILKDGNVSTKRWLNNTNVLWPHNRILFGLKRNEVLMHATIWMNFVKLNNPYRKGQLLYYST